MMVLMLILLPKKLGFYCKIKRIFKKKTSNHLLAALVLANQWGAVSAREPTCGGTSGGLDTQRRGSTLPRGPSIGVTLHTSQGGGFTLPTEVLQPDEEEATGRVYNLVNGNASN